MEHVVEAYLQIENASLQQLAVLPHRARGVSDLGERSSARNQQRSREAFEKPVFPTQISSSMIAAAIWLQLSAT
jgi:hypothetical protein